MKNEIDIYTWAMAYYGADRLTLLGDGMVIAGAEDGTVLGSVDDLQELRAREEWASEQAAR